VYAHGVTPSQEFTVTESHLSVTAETATHTHIWQLKCDHSIQTRKNAEFFYPSTAVNSTDVSEEQVASILRAEE
jgi:hypothetical protein